MASLNHLHIYERSKYNKEIYRCVHPQCSHYDRRGMIVGKEIECFKCHEVTLARQEQLHVGQFQLGTKVLTCIKCCKNSKKYIPIEVADVLNDMLTPVHSGFNEDDLI